MRFISTTAFRVSLAKNKSPFSLLQSNESHIQSLAQLRSTSHSKRLSFGIAFDIDGVVLHGRVPIGGSPRALKRLFVDSGSLKVPFLFLTNGGGIPESTRATELSEMLGVNILPLQVMQGHSPFKNLLERFENELIVATGKGNPALVMSEYGFKKVLSLEEYASYFENIDPVSQYKDWSRNLLKIGKNNQFPPYSLSSERVKAAFVISDPVDWGRDIQVLCDILRSGGLPGERNGNQQPPLYFSADDLEYQAAFPSKRLGIGAFRIALQNVFNRIHHKPLEYISFGKPNPFVFKNAEAVLQQLLPPHTNHSNNGGETTHSPPFKTLYMIGDNPSVDIKGARQAGERWFSILTRTGVYRGTGNHSEFPADLVVDTVEEAVDHILRREGVSS